MDESKDLVPAADNNQAGKLDRSETATDHKSVTDQPQFKVAGKVAPAETGRQDGLATDAADASTNAPLARPLPPRPRTRVPVRRKRRPWGWAVVVLVAVAAGAGAFFYARSTQTDTSFQGQTTTASTRLPVSITISSNGQVQANADLSLSFSAAGNITELDKKLGDTVKAGDVLGKIDDSDLQNALKNAQASFDQQQASYNTAVAGATQKDLIQAQAQVDSAKASLDQTVNGTFTAADVAAAQASLNSAAAKLAEDRQGGQPYDIASAQAGVSSAQAQLASAQAALAKTLAGPDNATLVSAQATYDQAQANYEKTESSLKLSVTNAQVAHDQALNSLKSAQDTYQSIYANNRNADGTLKTSLPQSAIDQETSAYRALQDAQGNFNKADAALNDAKVALDTQTRSLQSQMDDAKAQLDKTKAGPTPADIAAAQAQVASAQSGLDNAKKTLAALTPTQAQIAADEAAVTSAQASLAKLKGGTPDEVTQAQANLTSAQATLNDLKAGPKPNDIAIAKAQLTVAQANLDKAKADLNNAVLVSPISGTIVQAPATVGQAATASTVIYEVVDLSSLHVDVNVGESDISKIKEGTPVAVNLDGIPGRSFTGKVTFISSKSTVTNNVTSYLTTVTLDNGSANSLTQAYQSEFNKLLQGNRGQGQGQGQGAAGRNAGGVGAAQLAASNGICGYIPAGRNNATSQETPKAGMTANVTFCLNLKAGVLSVPNRAIQTKFQNGQRESYVNVLVDKATSKIEERPVLVGLVGDTYTEITGGNLKDGDVIVLSSTPTNRVTTGGGFFGGGGPGGGGGRGG
jgi:multidrug efflux pump subunit AcrA (membrane-fusion protein)